MTEQTTGRRERASGRIVVKTYEPQPYDEVPGAPTLNHITVTETFEGDIQGEGAVHFLQASRADGSASFVGIERVTGSVAGRSGTFLLQDSGTVSGSRVKGDWFVIPGSGTDQLSGLRGEGGFEADLGEAAIITLEYWFE